MTPSRWTILFFQPIDLSPGDLLYYGGVEWLNISDFLGKIKKGLELHAMCFVFKTAVVFLCKERLRQKKKSLIVSFAFKPFHSDHTRRKFSFIQGCICNYIHVKPGCKKRSWITGQTLDDVNLLCNCAQVLKVEYKALNLKVMKKSFRSQDGMGGRYWWPVL